MKFNSKTLALATVVACASLGSVTASALSLDATVTADNHYALFIGNEDGTVLSFIGRNEMGAGGSPGAYNWSEAESWSATYSAGDYVYLVGWSDNSVAQGWIGEFTSSTEHFKTSLSDGWEYLLGDKDLGDGSPAPTTAELAAVIAPPANWAAVKYSVPHGDSPWGFISGITHDAQWIWGTQNLNASGDGTGEFQVFRRPLAAPVPLPAPLVLLGSAFAALPFKRRKQSAA